MDVDLESTTQGTFFLPCKRRKRSPEPDDQQQQQPEPEPATPPAPALEAWTKAAYERSWAKHEARINDTLRRLIKRSSEQLVGWVSESYPVGAPRLPYASIPTALVSSTSAQTLHSLIATVELLLEERRKTVQSEGQGKEPAAAEGGADVDMDAPAVEEVVEPETRRTVIECKSGTSLEALVESIVLGLLGDDPATGSTPTLPSLLRFQESHTRLSITLHQIHLLPLRTLTSFLSVLTRYSPRLDLILILTTASAPGVLREVVPAAVMEALDMGVLEGIEGGDVWEEVVRDLYFSGWEPEVLLDGKTFDELHDTYDRNSQSVEGLISALQYIHMRAFFGPMGQFLPKPTAAAPDLYPEEREQAIFKRLLTLPSILQSSLASRSRAFQPPVELLLEQVALSAHGPVPRADFPRDIIAASHKVVHKHAADRRLAFAVFASVRNYLSGRRDDSGAAASGVARVRGPEAVRMMRAVVDGDAAGTDRGWVWTTKLVSKLAVSELPRLVDSIKNGVQGFALFHRTGIISELVKVRDSPSKMTTALENVFRRWITPHEDVLFNELYYFQELKDLTKVFRPTPLEALQTGLLSPQTYLGKASCNPAEATTLPDTTLLFLRYLESGKMINLYDWFEAFSSTLQVPPPSAADDEAQLERRREAQARFMRGFHELDYLGFLKGTKRKQDHVLKTFFMIGEEEGEGFLERQTGAGATVKAVAAATAAATPDVIEL